MNFHFLLFSCKSICFYVFKSFKNIISIIFTQKCLGTLRYIEIFACQLMNIVVTFITRYKLDNTFFHLKFEFIAFITLKFYFNSVIFVYEYRTVAFIFFWCDGLVEFYLLILLPFPYRSGLHYYYLAEKFHNKTVYHHKQDRTPSTSRYLRSLQCHHLFYS